MKTSILIALALVGGVAFAETLKVDPAVSTIAWKAGKKIGSFHNGTVKVKSGTVETGKKGNVTAATVVADMTTIANEDLASKPDMQKKLTGHLSSDDFFKVQQYPESTFVLKKITPKAAKGEYEVTGDLTMIGKTNPVTFPATIKQENGVLTGTGTMKIERLKWDLKYGSQSFFKSLTADKIINDDFELTLNITAKK